MCVCVCEEAHIPACVKVCDRLRLKYVCVYVCSDERLDGLPCLTADLLQQAVLLLGGDGGGGSGGCSLRWVWR